MSKQNEESHFKKYEFIVIGGGIAGTSCAQRVIKKGIFIQNFSNMCKNNIII